MRHTFAYCVPALLLALCSTLAFASNWATMHEQGPISFFKEQDLALFERKVQEALDSTPDGATRSWSNEETGASGTLTPSASHERDGTKCRRLEIFNSAGGRQGRSVFNFCRQADGSWKVAQ
ncbi:MAG: hypothetical protein JSW10_02660 [Pseudomonadota bacterium]|nr:MAG: hypothetical protein JSW10_02660 [Pseudomonadota bacterium]